MPNPASLPPDVARLLAPLPAGGLRSQWRVVLGAGGVLVLCGALALGITARADAPLSAGANGRRHGRLVVLHAALGAAYAILALAFWRSGAGGAPLAAWLLAPVLLVAGAARILGARWLDLPAAAPAAGIAAILLALAAAASALGVARAHPGLFIGAELMIGGAMWSALALHGRRLARPFLGAA